MKKLTAVLALVAVMFAAPALASTHKEAPDMKAPGSCEATAAEKKLSGAAKTSFLKKCNATPKTECDLKAGEKRPGSQRARGGQLEVVHGYESVRVKAM